jgi:hypothetical protein
MIGGTPISAKIISMPRFLPAKPSDLANISKSGPLYAFLGAFQAQLTLCGQFFFRFKSIRLPFL